MSYLEPKINWSSTDGVMDADFNRIEGNIKYLADNGVYKATCIYDTNVFTLSLINAPDLLPDIFTVNVKIPNEWVDASTFKIGDVTYTPTNAGFIADEVVNITFDNGVAKKCFFKSGGGGVTETLPQQVDTFTATSGNGVINLAWSISNTGYLYGFYIIYKPGTNSPTTLNDGIKIDITNPYATSHQIAGVTNGQIYSCRIMPYNDKKQVQTQYKVLTVTPTSNILMSSLPVGSKVLGFKDSSNTYNMPLIIIDKNHAGYPANSITLMCENCVTSLGHGSGSTYQYSAICITYFNSTFPSYLPAALRNYALATNIIEAVGWGSGITSSRKYFLLSRFELSGNADQGTVYEGTKFSYFASAAFRVSNINYWTRTPGINASGADLTYYYISTAGTEGKQSLGSSVGVRPVFNVSNTIPYFVSGSPNAQGYYELAA